MPIRNKPAPAMPAPTAAPGAEWRNTAGTVRLWCGDCLKVLPTLPAGSVDLVFNDPPFNLGLNYDLYYDRQEETAYWQWTKEWLGACRRVLKPAGSIYVAVGVWGQAEMKKLMDAVGFHWRSTICWTYTFGPRQETNWTPSWVAIHYATKDPNDWAWNPDAVRVPSARQLKYNDKRAVAGGKVPDNTWMTKDWTSASVQTQRLDTSPWMLLPNEHKEEINGRAGDVLLESRVCGTFKERSGHVCQMPLPVLERVILASSNPGDVVLDPMAGSGTTLEAALKHGRRAWGIELSPDYCDKYIKPRLEK